MTRQQVFVSRRIGEYALGGLAAVMAFMVLLLFLNMGGCT